MASARLGLEQHPAVAAWQSLGTGCAEPEGVETVEETVKSAVYRLLGAGEGGSAVIAKRGRSEGLLAERTIYLRVLACLPVPTLRYHGFLEDGDGACWLFLEDAGGRRYSTRRAGHRALAGRWLGAVHVAVDPGLQAELPDRGPNHYLEYLRSGRAAILRNLTHPELGPDERAILEATARQCDLLEASWGPIERFCETMPRTLVHGDFVQKNARIRDGRAGAELLILDWEFAGWGIPAVDLSQASGGALNPDLIAYWSVVQALWPGLELDDVVELANHGAVFQSLAAIGWESRTLDHEHVSWAVKNIALYRARLARALGVIERAH